MDWSAYLLQFLNVHLLLFGGATAYNSYWDKDEGPVGGLKHPPAMEPWMWSMSWALQGLGLLLALAAGWVFSLFYGLSILMFWLYSTPHTRWKGRPWKSLAAIGISTGTNSLLMGYLAADPLSTVIDYQVLSAAIGVAAVVLSLYPISQLYQLEEDTGRGDQTFAARYGLAGAARFFKTSFPVGIVLVAVSMVGIHPLLAVGFAGTGGLVWLWVLHQIRQFAGGEKDYDRVMRIKYRTSLAFVLFLFLAILIKHTDVGILSGLDLLW